MGGKSRQIFRNALPVPDVEEKAGVHGKIRFFTWYMQSTLSHDGKQSYRFHRHRLSPGIRPGYDHTFY